MLPVSTETRRVYEFSQFVLDLEARALLRDGRTVPLPSRAYELLVALVEARGRIVTKDELLDSVWEGAFVEESNLTVAVSALRRALGDNKSEPVFIETIPRRGYRFVPDVHEVTEANRIVRSIDGDVRMVQATRVEIDAPAVPFGTTVEQPALAVAPQPATSWRRPVATLCLAVAAATAMGIGVESRFASFDRVDPQARAELLRGRHQWSRRTGPGIVRSVEHFRRAIELEPGYADAYAGLAGAYVFDLADWPKAESAARTAIAYDPRQADAHAVIGFGRMFHQWDWAGAKDELDTALAIDPECVSALQWRAAWLAAHGRLEEAKLSLGKAATIDPVYAPVLVDLAEIAYFEHDYPRAISLAREALEIDPGIPAARVVIMNSAAWLDDGEAYMAARRELDARAGTAESLRAAIESAFASGGIKAVIRVNLERQLANPTAQAFGIATSYKWLDERDAALDWLERAVDEHAFGLVYLTVDPVFDDFRRLDRFRAIERRVDRIDGI
jgi:DNA-binding winged helix-turn-helix (wHTH) protein/tetratricopeptide (TPR) repeat protein